MLQESLHLGAPELVGAGRRVVQQTCPEGGSAILTAQHRRIRRQAIIASRLKRKNDADGHFPERQEGGESARPRPARRGIWQLFYPAGLKVSVLLRSRSHARNGATAIVIRLSFRRAFDALLRFNRRFFSWAQFLP